MFFGLQNSPATFQAMMNALFWWSLSKKAMSSSIWTIFWYFPNDRRTLYLVKKVLQRLEDEDLFFETRKMLLRTTFDRISRHDHYPRQGSNGSSKAFSSHWLANPKMCQRRPILFRIRQFLSKIHSGLCQHYVTSYCPYSKEYHVDLGRSTANGIRYAQTPLYLCTHSSHARLR